MTNVKLNNIRLNNIIMKRLYNNNLNLKQTGYALILMGLQKYIFIISV